MENAGEGIHSEPLLLQNTKLAFFCFTIQPGEQHATEANPALLDYVKILIHKSGNGEIIQDQKNFDFNSVGSIAYLDKEEHFTVKAKGAEPLSYIAVIYRPTKEAAPVSAVTDARPAMNKNAIVDAMQGDSFWQPEPTTGYATVKVSGKTIKDPEFIVFEQEIPPGKTLNIPQRAYSNQIEAFVHLSGSAELAIEDTVVTLNEESQTYYLSDKKAQTLTNKSDKPFRYMGIISASTNLDEEFKAKGQPRDPGLSATPVIAEEAPAPTPPTATPPKPSRSQQPNPVQKPSICMLVLSGFITAAGIAAVAVAFTLLNASTFGLSGMGLAATGLGLTLYGIGMFAHHRPKSKSPNRAEAPIASSIAC